MIRPLRALLAGTTGLVLIAVLTGGSFDDNGQQSSVAAHYTTAAPHTAGPLRAANGACPFLSGDMNTCPGMDRDTVVRELRSPAAEGTTGCPGMQEATWCPILSAGKCPAMETRDAAFTIAI